MNIPNFTSLLTALRAFILKSRPAYRDYLGTESVEEKTVLLTGTLSATGESVTSADGFTGFTNGQTYKATIGEETVEVTAQYGTGSFSECIVIGRSNVAPSDTIPGWMVCVYNGKLLGFGTGDWAGKQIEVATSKMVPVEKWDVKKLPEECLPEKMPEKWAEGLDTGGGVLYVPMELDFSSGTGTVNGVTFEEAQQAYKDGKTVVAVQVFGSEADGGEALLLPLLGAMPEQMMFYLEFAEIDAMALMILWAANGQVTCQQIDLESYKIIPVTVTQSNGEYTATSSRTYEQVKALVSKGKNVAVEARESNANTVFYLYLSRNTGTGLLFYGCRASGDKLLNMQLLWDETSIRVYDSQMLSENEYSNNMPLQASATPSPGTSTFVSRADHVHPKELPDGLELGSNYIILASSTANSTKKFKITVDDTGALTATEVTTTT